MCCLYTCRGDGRVAQTAEGLGSGTDCRQFKKPKTKQLMSRALKPPSAHRTNMWPWSDQLVTTKHAVEPPFSVNRFNLHWIAALMSVWRRWSPADAGQSRLPRYLSHHHMGIYCQRHLSDQKMLTVGFARSGNPGVDITFSTVWSFKRRTGDRCLSQTILTLIVRVCDLLTFLWQTSSLSISWLPVQQLTLRAARGHWGSPDRIPIITEGVPSAWIPGGGLPQPSLGLGLQTGFLDVAAGCRQPVAIDLV